MRSEQDGKLSKMEIYNNNSNLEVATTLHPTKVYSKHVYELSKLGSIIYEEKVDDNDNNYIHQIISDGVYTNIIKAGLEIKRYKFIGQRGKIIHPANFQTIEFIKKIKKSKLVDNIELYNLSTIFRYLEPECYDYKNNIIDIKKIVRKVKKVDNKIKKKSSKKNYKIEYEELKIKYDNINNKSNTVDYKNKYKKLKKEYNSLVNDNNYVCDLHDQAINRIKKLEYKLTSININKTIIPHSEDSNTSLVDYVDEVTHLDKLTNYNNNQINNGDMYKGELILGGGNENQKKDVLKKLGIYTILSLASVNNNCGIACLYYPMHKSVNYKYVRNKYKIKYNKMLAPSQLGRIVTGEGIPGFKLITATGNVIKEIRNMFNKTMLYFNNHYYIVIMNKHTYLLNVNRNQYYNKIYAEIMENQKKQATLPFNIGYFMKFVLGFRYKEILSKLFSKRHYDKREVIQYKHILKNVRSNSLNKLESVNNIISNIKDINFKLMILKKQFKDSPTQLKEFIHVKKSLIKKKKEPIKLNRKQKIKNKLKQITSFYNDNEDTDKKIVLKVGLIHYTLDRLNLESVMSILDGEESILASDESESDKQLKYAIFNNPEDVEIMVKDVHDIKPSGAFFNYLLNDDVNLDLVKYGIYKKWNKDNYINNCFIKAFYNNFINKDNKEQITNIINQMKVYIKDRQVVMSDLKELANKFNLNIELTRKQSNSNRTRVTKFKTKTENDKTLTLKLALINNHYFINEETKYKQWQIKNIIEPTKENKKGKNISSYRLVSLLIDNSDILLKKLTFKEISNIQYNNEIDIDEFELDEKLLCKEMKFKKQKIINYSDLIALDVETNPDRNGKFIVDTCAMTIHNNNIDDQITVAYIGENSVERILDLIKDNSCLLIHNATFDFRFIYQHLKHLKILQNNNRLYSAIGYYKKKKIYIKDTYCMIPLALKEFSESFKIKTVKEVINHDYYDYQTIKQTTADIELFSKGFNDKDKQIFINNILKWNLTDQCDKTRFNHIKYRLKYCEIDTIVTLRGYNKFRKDMLDVTGLDILNYLTISQIANSYMLKSGVYDDCYQLSGIAREFISKCIVGGKCQTADNKKYHIKYNEEIKDKTYVINNDLTYNCKVKPIDENSQYPAAMNNIGEELGGYLKGKPIRFTNNNEINMTYEWLEANTDGYFIAIKILDIGRTSATPAISYLDEKTKGRIWTSDIELVKGRTLYVTKINLNDWIKYHKIKYKIIRGYYYNQGRNNVISTVITNLFNLRLKYKGKHDENGNKLPKSEWKKKNPIQLAYKLIMNSAYGRTIMKPRIKETMLIPEDKFDKFFQYHYNTIYSYIKNDKYYKVVKYNTFTSHYSAPHIGSEILAMAKRSMNKLIYILDELKVPVFYIDTDSLHLDIEKIDKICSNYKELYNKELIGKQLGQFSNDFDFKVDSGTDPVAIECYYVGKKFYIEDVECIVEKEIIYNKHIRAKGISVSAIDKPIAMNTYNKLYKGKSVAFDIAKNAVKMDFRNNGDIYKRRKFIRTVQFK